MSTNNDDMKHEACNFIKKEIPSIIAKWPDVPNRTIEEQIGAVKEYFSLFSDSGIQCYNLKATPNAEPIKTLATWNRDIILSSGRYKRYNEYKLEPINIYIKPTGEFHVESIFYADIDGWSTKSEVVHIIKKFPSGWKIFKTLDMNIEPGHAGYDSLFCRWMFPHVGSVKHIGALLARFSKYFVKTGLSSALWKAQPKRGKIGDPSYKFGIIAQKLLTAYLFGAVPADWQVLTNSHEGRAEIDIRLIEPSSEKHRMRTYYIESKASSIGVEQKTLTTEEKDQIDRISPIDYKQYHIVRFGFEEHYVYLQKHKLPDGRKINVTVWYVRHS